jgi:PAS domain S-box-containing protein
MLVEKKSQKLTQDNSLLVNTLQNKLQRTRILFQLFSSITSRQEYLDTVLQHLRAWSDCQCIGIRVLNSEGSIPYEAYVGFSKDFWESENSLSIDRDECICTRVVLGVSNLIETSCRTKYGSFCSNNLIKFISELNAEEKLSYRCKCAEVGFKSLAIIPINHREKILGVIQLADKQLDRLQIVEFIEYISPLIGEAIIRFDLEDQLRKRNMELEEKVNERTEELKRVNELLQQDINKRQKLEEYLKEELNFRQVLIDTIPNPVFYKDSDGKYQGCNKSYERTIGLSKEQIKGKTVHEVCPKDIADKYYEMDSKLFEQQGCQEYEFLTPHIDGTRHNVIFNKGVFKNQSGYPVGLVGVMTDITERKKMENELINAKQTVSDILESITDAFFALDDHWNIVYANKTALRYFGESKAESIGQDFRTFIPQLFDTDTYHYLNEALNQKTDKHFETQDKLFGTWLEVHIYPSQEGVSVYCNDISNRKLMERSIQYLASIVENSSNAIYSTDLKGFILTWNPRAHRIFGYSADEIIGKSAEILYPPNILNQFKEFLEKVNQGEYVCQHETLHVRKDGSLVNVSVTKSPIKNERGEVIAISSIVEDITRRIELEKEMLRLDRLNLVGEMAASIAHEIRNPMTTVKGFLQLFKRKEKFSEEHAHFDLMIDELDRTNSIITEFLSLAKNRIVDLKLLNLNLLIRSLFPLLQADALLREMNIELMLDEIPEILLDEKEIRQLLINLVRNGFEAMSPGGKMSIRTYLDKNELVLDVKDNGQGIPPEILDKLGTPFFTTKENGSGLGLAICYSIANRHNAKLEVDSGTDGTTFSLRFKI